MKKITTTLFACLLISSITYGQYLPLSAGSSYPLTGPLDFANATTHAEISVNNGDYLSIEAFNPANTVKKPIALAAYGGNVGIGTANPSELLTIGSEYPAVARNVLRIGAGSYSEPATINTSSAGDKIILFDNVSSQYDARIGVGDHANFWMKSFSGAGSDYGNFEWYSGTNSTSPQMTLSGSGNLSIGTTDAHNYKLAVNGSAIATSMTVKSYGQWGDYIFDKDYQLPTLNDLKSYINQNHHLPDMPSAQEIADKGINLGDIVTTQTKKIEELTLYLIDKDKQLSEQQDLLKQQQENNKQLNDRVAALEQALAKLTASK